MSGGCAGSAGRSGAPAGSATAPVRSGPRGAALLPRPRRATPPERGTSFFGPQHREQNHLADVRLVREDHQQPVDTEPDAARRRHAVLERPQEVLVELLRVLVARGPQVRLLLEAAALLLGIVELAEGVGDLAAVDEQLPALDLRGIAPLQLGQGRQRHRKSTRLNSSHVSISYADFCLKKKNKLLILYFYNNKKNKHLNYTKTSNTT